MIIKKGLKINKIELSSSSGRPYFEIQFDDNKVERIYLMLHNDLLLSIVFVFDDNHRPIQISKDNLGLLQWIDYSTCDISYDVRMFDKNIIRYFVIDILIRSNDTNFITEKVSLGVEDPFEEE